MIKILLILSYLACDYQAFGERLSSVGGGAMLAVFLALYALLASGLLLGAFIRNHPVRLTLATLFAAASIMQQSFEWTTQGAFTYEAFLNLYNASGQVSEAVAQHGHVLAKAVLAAALLFLGIALPPRRPRIDQRLAAAGLSLAFLSLSALLYLRGGEGSRALPAAYPALSYVTLMTGENLMKEDGPREKVTIHRDTRPVTRDIILLVDESIAGNYLDINNPNGVRSGLNQNRPGIRTVNFGYAGSVHRCSANSNVVLRYGGTQANYQRSIVNWPSIWSYAKKAGLRTVYLDAQSNGGALQNMMTMAERREIDDFVQFDGVPAVERDMRIANILADRINNGRPELIYVNKIGAHFPIQDKFPENYTQYQPVLPRGDHPLAIWTSDRTGFDGTPDQWVRYRNSYRNTLLWNVGTFFDRLFAKADLNNATIIYTSDHGQDLHERGNPGNNTHCGAENAAQEEGLVPLVVIEGANTPTLNWAPAAKADHNGSNHFHIFPTLLTLMGYDRAAVKERYGPALDEAAPPALAYNINFYTYLGKAPEFRKIDASRIVDPPSSDYIRAAHK
jgi:glucan phosphoethanolaminetransferase (alkaline phosphatase superfamily)